VKKGGLTMARKKTTNHYKKGNTACGGGCGKRSNSMEVGNDTHISSHGNYSNTSNKTRKCK